MPPTPRRRCLALGSLGLFLALPLGAQLPRPFGQRLVVSGEWLQATALPLDRDAAQSASGSLGLRGQRWSAEAGFLRIARTLSTVQGGFLSIGRIVNWQSVQFIPAVSVLGGQAYVSIDSTGYDWKDAQGNAGHTPRYTYSEGGTFGGGVGVTAELPLYRALAARASVSQWFFSGSPMAEDRARTLVGVGLSLRVGR